MPFVALAGLHALSLPARPTPPLPSLFAMNTPPETQHTDAERRQQELVVLRGVDPQQRQGLHLRHPAEGAQDVHHLRRQHHRHPGGVEARGGAVHGHVPAKGLPPLVSCGADCMLSS